MKLKRECRPKLTADAVASIEECARNGLSSRQTSAKLELPRSTIMPYWTKAKPKAEGGISRKESAEDCAIEFSIRKRVVTLADALAHTEVDLTIWYVDKWEIIDWEMGYATGPKTDREAKSLPLHRVKLFLKRIRAQVVHQAMEAVYERMAKIAFDYTPIAYPPATREKVLCEVDLMDLHAGKYSWAREVGEDYDLAISMRRVRNAIEDILSRAAAWNVEQFLVPVGNDLVNADNFKNETTAGTPQDCDGRIPKVIEATVMSLIWGIEQMLKVAPVKGVYLPGNHCKMASYTICREIAAYFRNCPHVTFDLEPTTRKIHRHGGNLIGLIHGDGVKGSGINALPIILNQMAIKAGVDLRAINNYEFHCGHRHHEKSYSVRDLDTIQGTRIRWLTALTSTDAWHHSNLMFGGAKAADAFLYSKENWVGQIQVQSRDT